MLEWLRVKIVNWLRVPTEVENYQFVSCVFYRESPGDVPYVKKIGEASREHFTNKG